MCKITGMLEIQGFLIGHSHPAEVHKTPVGCFTRWVWLGAMLPHLLFKRFFH